MASQITSHPAAIHTLVRVPDDTAPNPTCRVAGAVARPGSHRTVLALFAHGSSERRVAGPAAGRFATSIFIPTPMSAGVGRER